MLEHERRLLPSRVQVVVGDAVAAPGNVFRRDGEQERHVESAERIVLHKHVPVVALLLALEVAHDGIERDNALGVSVTACRRAAVGKHVAAYDDIATRAGFIPVVVVSGKEERRARHLVEEVGFDQYGLGRREERPARTVVADHVAAERGRALVVRILHRVANAPAIRRRRFQRHLHIPLAKLPHGLHADLRTGLQRIAVDEPQRFAGQEDFEADSLMMHVAAAKRIAAHDIGDGQARRMDVDGIVHHALEPAVLHDDLAFDVREVAGVRMG